MRINEYKPYDAGRAAGRRLIKKGDASTHNTADHIMNRDRWSNSDRNEYQRGLEDISNDEFNEQPTNNLVGENMNKKLIKLTEADLHRIIRESVDKILNEYGNSNTGQYMLGALAAKKRMQGNEKGQTDDESGFNDVSNYAKQQRGDSKMKANSFYNGFHSSKDNRGYGYNQMKKLNGYMQ